jgi:hypothetical protein
MNPKALEYLKDWSNYLLVTTVAALGWVATVEQLGFRCEAPSGAAHRWIVW